MYCVISPRSLHFPPSCFCFFSTTVLLLLWQCERKECQVIIIVLLLITVVTITIATEHDSAYRICASSTQSRCYLVTTAKVTMPAPFMYLLWPIFYSPEEKIRQLEKKVNELIEESCFANSRGELQLVSVVLCRIEMLIRLSYYRQSPTYDVVPLLRQVVNRFSL